MSLKERDEFCRLAGTTRRHVQYQIAAGHARPGIQLALRMITASKRMYPEQQSRWLTLKVIYSEGETA
jgi:hypothetical protein